jgi:hypothetical protein
MVWRKGESSDFDLDKGFTAEMKVFCRRRAKERRLLIKIILGFAIVILSSISILFIVISWYDLAGKEIGLELAKALLQVIVVIVLGEVVSMLVSRYNRQRQSLIELSEFKKTILKDLSQIKSTSQKVVNTIRGNGLSFDSESHELATAKIKAEVYQNEMQLIYEIRRELRRIEEDIQTFAYTFSEPEELISRISSMRAFFKNLTKEYENYSQSPTNKNPLILLSNFPELSGFIIPEIKSEQITKLEENYRLINNSIRKDILRP